MKRQLFKHGILLLGLIGAGILGGALHGTRAQSQDEVTIAKQFVGMWRLVSRPERLADGTMKQNSRSFAYIIYTDTGHMCFVSMNPSRPNWKSANAPTTEEMVSGLVNNGFGAYCATVEVHAKEGFVLHHVEIEKSPNLVGRTRKRWFTFDGPNHLSLRIDPPELIPPIVESTLIWERVQK